MWRFGIFLVGMAFAHGLLRGWPEELPPVMRACAAVLVLVAVIGVWVRRPREALPGAKGRRAVGVMDYVAVVAAVLAVESAFLWFLTAAPDRLEDAAVEVRAWLRPGDEEAAVGGAGTRAGNWLWDDETRRPLPKRTNFKPGNRPEVFIRLRDPADSVELLARQVYVGAFALGRYRQAGWQAFPGEPGGRLLANEAGFVEVTERPGRSIAHEVFHGAQEGRQNSLTGLQGVVLARVPELLRLDSGLHLLPPVRSVGGYEYLVASKPMRLEDLAAEVVVAWPDAPEALLALPERRDLAERIRELAVLAGGDGPLYNRLMNLQNHLRTTLRYSLETTNARDLDPLENFLFYEQQGHCEFFATAGALLARALGVPARVAYGWAGGTYYESSGLFVFRAREAHAWTEVWLDGLGWVVMEPTPPDAIGGDLAEVAPPGAVPPGAEEIEMVAEEDVATSVGGGAARVGKLLTLWFGIPAVGLWLWRGLRARRVVREGRVLADGESPQPDYLKAWRRACAARGVAIPAGVPLRRHARTLQDGHALGERLVSYHYRVRYEGGAPDPAAERRLLAEIRYWQRKDVNGR